MVAPSIEQLVDDHAVRSPEAPAVDDGERLLTYAQLASRSREIAAGLQEHGLPPGTVIGLALPAGPELVAAIVGVLRAGLAFQPMHLDSPRARQEALLARAGARLVLTPESLARIGPGTPAECRPIAGTLAYVIFTSGSTGEPKGVMVSRGSFAAMLAAHEPLGLRCDDRYLVFASPHFDGFLVDTFVPLAAGACAVILPRAAIMPGEDLATALVAKEITFATIPPAALAVLPRRRYPALRGILTAGDRIPAHLAAYWSGQVGTFLNSYGPTETTVAATLGAYPPGEPEHHIGSPLPGAAVHILDDEGVPVPTGQVGEIYVGGWGVARGYIGDPGLTAARFVPDPFSQVPGARLYRTGDLGCRRPDGTIDFHGRRDEQLKVRGVRIHPAEIENALLSSGLLRAAVVVAAGAGAEMRLVAYVVPAPETLPSDGGGLPERLRRVVRDDQPPEHLPQEIRVVDRLPVGSTGKVDRGLLAEQALVPATAVNSAPHAPSAAPDAELRRRVAALWAEALGAPVDPDAADSFFELGGHSLLAAKLLGRLETEFGVVMRYIDFFRHPTIAGTARWLAERSSLRHIDEVWTDLRPRTVAEAEQR